MTFNPFSMINTRTSFEDIRKILAAIEEKAAVDQEAADTGVEDQGDDIALLREKLSDMETEYTLLNSLLEKVYEQTDKGLPAFEAMVKSAVTDYRGAYDLTTMYSKEWFSRLFMSLDAKIQLAGFLIDLVAPFNVPNTDAWQLLVENDPDMLAYVSVPHADS